MTKILANAGKDDVAVLAAEIQKKYSPVLIKGPGKTLAMINMRDPVRESRFYLGEVIVCEAAVELDGVKGFSVAIGDDEEKTVSMAVIDAAINKGVFTRMDKLLTLEKEQNDIIMRENAMHLKTMVSFETMDQEAPGDVNAFKKTRF